MHGKSKDLEEQKEEPIVTSGVSGRIPSNKPLSGCCETRGFVVILDKGPDLKNFPPAGG